MGNKIATACYRELGAELRRIREAAGLTEVQLSREMDWTTTKISKAEHGLWRINTVDVITYLAFCGVYGNYTLPMRELCREAEPKPGHWVRQHEAGLPDATRSLIYHESTASASTSYEPEFVPGLLQTEAYIRALTAEWWPNWDVDFAVGVRKERQRVVHHAPSARFAFYVHENALRLKVGDDAVMHEQLLMLLLLDGLPHVDIRVVPSVGAQTLFGGSFRLFEYDGHQPLVYLDGPALGVFLEDGEYVDGYRSLIQTIANTALNEGQSRECLAAIASDYDRERADRDVHDTVEEEQVQPEPDERLC